MRSTEDQTNIVGTHFWHTLGDIAGIAIIALLTAILLPAIEAAST